MKMRLPLTAREVLSVGHWFRREDHVYEIVAWDAQEPLRVVAHAVDSAADQTFLLTELFAPTPVTRFAATRAALGDRLPGADQPPAADTASLPAHLLRRADHIITVVEAVQVEIERLLQAQQVARNISLTEITRRACQALPTPVSLSGYYRYRQLYRAQHGDRALLAVALHRDTFGTTRLSASAQHFIDTIVRRFYRSNPPLRAETVYGIAQQLWEHNRHWWLNHEQIDAPGAAPLIERLLAGREAVDGLLADPVLAPLLTQIQLPSRTWFYGHVSWLSAQPGAGAQTYIARHGRADWEANFQLFDRFAQTATLPLQYVFADHYKLDVLHVDDEFREILGRLWLTLLIDAYSRAVLGIFLSYEAPNIESIQGALRHAIWPKTDLAAFGIDQPWLCYGLPQRLFLDNAWAHQSQSLETLVKALAGGGCYTQIELVFRPTYQARYGGLVERIFGNLSGQLRERLPGALLRPEQRHWHNASQGACLLYRDVVRIMNQVVVDYLHTPHRELGGVTPHEQWLTGLRLLTPVPPPLTPHLARCFWRLHPDSRRVTANGLALFGLHYWAPALDGLRSPDRQGQRRSFQLRYDPTDVSRVAVFEAGQWLGDGYARELRLPDGSYEPTSLWELALAKDLMRQQNARRTAHPHSWLLHLLEARELIAQRQEEQKLIRRRLQQLRAQRQGSPAAVREAVKLPTDPASPPPENLPACAGSQHQDRDPRMRVLEMLQEVL